MDAKTQGRETRVKESIVQPLFQAPGIVASCEKCADAEKRAETYRARMKAADRRCAALLGEIARLKDDLDYANAAR